MKVAIFEVCRSPEKERRLRRFIQKFLANPALMGNNADAPL